MTRFYLLSSIGTAQLSDIRVDLSGTGADNGDVSSVKIYKSTDATFDSGSDTLIGSSSVNGSNYAQIDIVDQTIYTTINNQYFFVVYDVAPAANATHAITGGFSTPGSTYFTITSPDTMANTNLPFETSPETDIQAVVATLSAIDTAPSVIDQGDRDDFLSFSITTAGGNTTLESLTIDQLGTLLPAQVTEVGLWRSADQVFDVGDTKIGTGTFASPAIITGLSETINTSINNYYFVTLKVDGNADTAKTIGARISAGGFSVSAGSASSVQTDSSIALITEVFEGGVVNVYNWNQAPRAVAEPQAGFTRTIATQKLAFINSTRNTTMTAVGVTKQGTMADSAVDEVRIYESSDGSFDELTDTLIATGTFTGGMVVLTLSPSQQIEDIITSYYYLVIVVNDTASIGDTVGTVLPDENSVVATSATVSPFLDKKSYLITIIGEPHGSPNNPGAFTNTSLCGACHMVHLAPTGKRILQKVFTKEPEEVNGSSADVFAELCFSCHDGSGSSVNIKEHYDSSGANAGHKIDYTGDASDAVDYGYPARGITYNAGTQLPCMICHDVHQSRNGNYAMLADELYEYATTATQNNGTGSWDSSSTLWASSSSTDEVLRKRCEVCHRSADGLPHTGPTQDGTGGFADNKSVIVGIDMARPGSHTSPPKDTQVCYGAGGCHLNAHNPGVGESSGDSECSLCHPFYENMNSSTSTYHHYMQNAEVTALTSSSSKYPTKNLFGAGDGNAEERRCLMCHVDHDIFSPGANPDGIRASNLRIDATSIPTSITDSTNTDFVSSATKGGICLSCHENSQTKSTTRAVDGSSKTLVVDKDQFMFSAHQYTEEPTSTFPSDNSTFRPNCVKCHSTMTSANYGASKQNSTYRFELHDGPYRRLLSVLGISSPSDPLEQNFCYECHSGATSYDYYGGQAMSTASQGIENLFTGKTYTHPITASPTTKHVAVEGESSGWNTRGDRHIECEDCHNPHGAKAGNHNVGEAEVSTDKDHGAKVGGPNVGVWGVMPTYQLYSDGTASFTDASTNVTGSDTLWDSNLQAGWFIKNTWDMAGRWYEIDVVNSDTQLTLVTSYDSGHSSPSGTLMISGVDYVASGATYSRTSNAENQYEVCLKCHSDYAFDDAPPDTPSGHADGTTIEETNVSHDFNTEQFAIHPVTGLGKNQPIVATGDVPTAWSAWNDLWPNWTDSDTGEVAISTAVPAVASFSSAFPTTVIPGWYLKYGTYGPSEGPQSHWYQVTKVLSTTSVEVTPTPSELQVSNPFSLTAGLGNAFVAPWGPWSRMVCSDCHSADGGTDPEGPHGSSQKWLLKEADPNISFEWWFNDTVETVEPNKLMRVNQDANTNQSLTATAVIFCYNCHRRDVYGDVLQEGAAADNPDIAGALTSTQNRVPHDVTSHKSTYTDGFGSKAGWNGAAANWGEFPGIVCMTCHGGDSLGGMHGTNAKLGAGDTDNRGERFLNGATWRGVTRATTSVAVKCWIKNNADEVNWCTQGHSGKGASSKANYDWPGP